MKKILYLLILFTSFCFSQVKFEDGPFKEYYKNGQLKQEGFYRNNKKIKVWKTYYENGQLLEVYVNDNNGKFTGMKQEYSKEGVILKETKNDIEGRLTTYEYDENGILFCSVEIKEINNKGRYAWSGPYKEYYKNGVLKVENNYDNYELTGLWKQFYETGELEWEVRYVDGYKQGEYAQYYKNGGVKISGNCELNKKEGEEKHLDSNGNLLGIIKYKKGEFKKATNKLSNDEVFIPEGVIMRPPVFPGCEEVLGFNAQKKCLSNKINGFVNSNFNVSKFLYLSKTNERIRVKTNVTFKINEAGDVVNLVAKSGYQDVEEEAIRVIRSLPKLKPGRQRGKPVTVPYALPIVFAVSGN